MSYDRCREAPAGEAIDDGWYETPEGEVRMTGGGGVGGEYRDEPLPGNEWRQSGGGGIGEGRVAHEEVSMWPVGGEYLMGKRR